jgi:hypothetical protein
MSQRAALGAKVRRLRQRHRITQSELARALGISPSYMNLIEHDQRAVTAPLLLKLAEALDVELRELTSGPAAQLHHDLAEALSDPLFDELAVAPREVDELCAQSPNVARAMLRLYRSFRDARGSADMLASQIYDVQQVPGGPSRLPSEEVGDFLQRHGNYFEALEEAADRLRVDAKIELDDPLRGLVRHCNDALGVSLEIGRTTPKDGVMRRFDAAARRLHLSEWMPPSSRAFQLAVQIGLLRERELLDRLVPAAELGGDAVVVSLARVVLANYFAAAVLMPYAAFLDGARSHRYDIELLQNRFGTSFEQVCHRLTTLSRPGASGVPFHMLRVDLAGNISKRFSASGIRFARFSGACPRWNVFTAFMSPGVIRVQVSTMPDGVSYFCLARTVPKGKGGYLAPHTLQAIGLGCQLEHAPGLVYSDGIDLERLDGAVPVGVTCRLCERSDCEQRAFPSIRAPMAVDENVRGPSVYAPRRDASTTATRGDDVATRPARRARRRG